METNIMQEATKFEFAGKFEFALSVSIRNKKKCVALFGRFMTFCHKTYPGDNQFDLTCTPGRFFMGAKSFIVIPRVNGCHGNHAFFPLSLYLRTRIRCISGVSMTDLGPRKKCSWDTRQVKLAPGVHV